MKTASNRSNSEFRSARRAVIAGLAPCALILLAPCANAQEQRWITQFGSSASEAATALAPDQSGGVMIGGTTHGSLGGPNAGAGDVFVARFDDTGTQVWLRQFGTGEGESGRALAPDGSGGVVFTGTTKGSLGGPNTGLFTTDVFLARYDSAGSQVWLKQFGTSRGEIAYALEPDGAGGVFVAGETGGSLSGPNAGGSDAFLARYDSAGNQIWIQQFGTNASDVAEAIASDGAGGVVIAGFTWGSLGGPAAGLRDVWLSRYDSNGNQVWLRQLGTSEDESAHALVPDGVGGVIVAGETQGSLGAPNAGGIDAFLARYDGNGAPLWIRQFGTDRSDQIRSLAPDEAGGAMAGGWTQGRLGGPNAGGSDAFLARYDSAGAGVWIRQFGTTVDDIAWALTPGAVGSVVIAGGTKGSLAGPNAGADDGFLAQYAIESCYADCDQSTGAGVLDIFDFLCFQNAFVNSDPYACDCDVTTGPLVCDIFDFLCFQNAFVGGCP
jgi:hypothetical protein